jgi:hypothetical protein
MAIRPVYIVIDNSVEKLDIEFQWSAGFAITQKQKSIRSLHEKIAKNTQIPLGKIIEISSRSENELGVALSAFNLKTKTQEKEVEYSVESAFQASKVFENGGPFTEILCFDSRSAKKDPRLKDSGKLLYFTFFGNRFELHTGTAFYDWIYINVLLKNSALCDQIVEYRAFTDIEFNPKKSLNTQAFSIALFVALKLSNTDMSQFRDPEVFLEKTRKFYNKFSLI